MADAYLCNNCTEYFTGKPAATVIISPPGTPTEEQADLCPECHQEIQDNLNLSEDTIDL